MNSLTVPGHSHFKKSYVTPCLLLLNLTCNLTYKPDYFSRKLIRAFPVGQSDIFSYYMFVAIQITKCSLENYMIGEATMCKGKTMWKIWG